MKELLFELTVRVRCQILNSNIKILITHKMSKEKEAKKNNKKTAVKNLKEKRAAKAAKRAVKSGNDKFKL